VFVQKKEEVVEGLNVNVPSPFVTRFVQALIQAALFAPLHNQTQIGIETGTIKIHVEFALHLAHDFELTAKIDQLLGSDFVLHHFNRNILSAIATFKHLRRGTL
jgi:hypothetical protein